jgi:cell division protease FtsH
MLFLVESSLGFMTSPGFMSNFEYNRKSSAYYDGNNRNKNNLRDIDYKLSRQKGFMKRLIKQKKNIIKNMTGIDLSISDEDFFEQYVNREDEDEEHPQIIITFENENDDDNEMGSNSNSNSETKSENFEVLKDTGYSFKSVGGYDIIKQEMMQCADLLVNYQKYSQYNVRTPKGLILEGPPGNGKTLLARSFSGEINVSFIAVSGAQFQEKYVGVGAARVRELFELASKHVPCIIFIDEIDAVCRRRTEQTSHAEHDSTLNELLVSLDGFKSTKGIFIIGATNRVDLLDDALTRPGRIDKKIYIGNPDKATQEAILKIHLKGKPMEEIEMSDLLVMTQGLSGAQIENLLNEAMLLALRENRTQMSRQDLELIANRIHTGFQPSEKKITESQLYQIAIHEMGHAFTALLTKYKKVVKVSINLFSPQCLGFTLFETSQSVVTTKQELMCELMVLLGGRIAEEIFCIGGMTTSASRDLEYTKKIAEQMVITYGMGDKIVYPQGSDEYRKLIDREIDNLIAQAYDRTKTLLLTIQPLIKDSAEVLVKKREVKIDELQILYRNYLMRL